MPPRVEYSLTPHGYTLCPVLKQMWHWGRGHLRQEIQTAVSSN
ncbi:winged helix-turn-helix transcriptional regulator [Hymenobacter koreensis]